MKNFGVICLAALVAACTTVNVTLVEQETGLIGRGTADAGENSGTMKVAFADRTFEGPWTVMRTAGGETYYLSEQGHVGVTAIGSSGRLTSDSASGMGVANLSAGDGTTMRCEFKYSMVGLRVSGLGVCRDREGKLYDLQISS
ncbi:hypothetical protein [uncultured Parvibaculum sp.]|uniref:hypothetical protein n=1 Tax=uncultured Parvibaculum sp. TaxID=291828 RepID=UPI0030EE2510